ncbi:Peptidyl-prolyl cis-trans isomerase fpr2 [Pleurotus ostreatus]|uniref:peptidylprolyl isomerase n=1 Tax=Pleurotus ostreatus TaxID=5322 RepID=A0A8H6ZTK1_PLEOS|nr:Peptidyl-prolyl cis-trans isomerase fpr2 [Pleurotus ostreatus]KAF7428021.1 Peptidyl-prolyl cis-trans isomerase fpr2 [Pleurotus ostreatus]
MWPFSVFACLAFVISALAVKEPPTKLQIDATFTPEDCSVKAKSGDGVRVHYTGTLFATGDKFDSSHDRGQPLPLTLGVGQVIQGWDEGLQGMCVNERRTLTIPANMAYGSRGFGSIIPPNSALVFEVKLVGLDSKGAREEL